jgi:hypothetical protein
MPRGVARVAAAQFYSFIAVMVVGLEIPRNVRDARPHTTSIPSSEPSPSHRGVSPSNLLLR